jgi:hypothetical protein
MISEFDNHLIENKNMSLNSQNQLRSNKQLRSSQPPINEYALENHEIPEGLNLSLDQLKLNELDSELLKTKNSYRSDEKMRYSSKPSKSIDSKSLEPDESVMDIVIQNFDQTSTKKRLRMGHDNSKDLYDSLSANKKFSKNHLNTERE